MADGRHVASSQLFLPQMLLASPRHSSQTHSGSGFPLSFSVTSEANPVLGSSAEFPNRGVRDGVTAPEIEAPTATQQVSMEIGAFLPGYFGVRLVMGLQVGLQTSAGWWVH